MHCARVSSDWLMVREQSGVSGILIINLCFRLSKVYITVVSMLPPSSTLGVVVVGCLCLADQLKDMLQIVMYILGGGTRTLFSHRTTVYSTIILLLCLPLFLNALTSLALPSFCNSAKAY